MQWVHDGTPLRFCVSQLQSLRHRLLILELNIASAHDLFALCHSHTHHSAQSTERPATRSLTIWASTIGPMTSKNERRWRVSARWHQALLKSTSRQTRRRSVGNGEI